MCGDLVVEPMPASAKLRIFSVLCVESTGKVMSMLAHRFRTSETRMLNDIRYVITVSAG
jgi:hypothetical protein